MGIKSRAAAAIVVLLLVLGSLWIREYFCVTYTMPLLFEMSVLQIRNVSHVEVAAESSMVVTPLLFTLYAQKLF